MFEHIERYPDSEDGLFTIIVKTDDKTKYVRVVALCRQIIDESSSRATGNEGEQLEKRHEECGKNAAAREGDK